MRKKSSTGRVLVTTTLFLSILVLCLATVPQPVQAENARKVALVMKALSNPFFSKMEEGARKYADSANIPLEVFGVDRETDVAMQIGIIESLISRGYGALVIAPADSKQLVPVCRKAMEKGIQVIIIDNPLHGPTLKKHGLEIPFVGSDNRAGAAMVGDYLKRRLNGRGKVIVLEGIRGVENADLRRQGFVETITKDSSIKIGASDSANWHTDEAFSLTTSLLTMHPDVDAIFCANDAMALGALQALQLTDLDGKVLIGAYDNIEEVRDAMRTGQIHATVEQHPELMGQFGVQLAWQALQGQKIPKYQATPLDLITHESFGRKVGIFISDLKNPFFTMLVNGAQDAADLFGYQLNVFDAGNDDARQVSDLMTSFSENVELILINPTNSDTIVPGIELANERGVPVITVDRKSSGGKITSHIASDNFKGGVMAAEAMVRFLGGKGKVIEFEGIPGASAAHDRGKGFNSVIDAHKDIVVTKRVIANFDRKTAQENMRRLLGEGDSFAGVFAHNDNMALGILDVLAETDYKKPLVTIGFDALPEAVEAVSAGRLTATIAQQPRKMGWLAARDAARLLCGETLPETTLIELRLIER